MFKRTLLVAAIAAMPVLSQAQTMEQMQQQLDILAQEIEGLKAQKSSGSALDKLHIGGYGELHYNNYLENVKNDQVDAHRFVLYFAYDYNEKVRFFSEFELESSLAGDGKPGEVELEQAYIEIDTSENTKAKVGLFMVPVGILNETHEPDTFYGVERNVLENKIIPATWWETGAMFSQNIGAFTYDIAGHSGLNMFKVGGVPNKIRSGRQKSAEANANKGAVTGSVRYAGLPGLDLAVSAQYQQDVYQSAVGFDAVPGVLVEAHARYSIVGATFTVQHAQWEFDKAIGNKAAEEQGGLMAEASYKFTDKIGVFVRHTDLDYNDGGNDLENTERQDDTVGINYWVVPRVVLKADYNDVSYDNVGKNDDADDSFNLGLGWSF
jgi:hypothetical protein